MSLATKYRPKTFDDVVGQSVVTKVLKRQIEEGKIKNAYLFCGPSGDGKTTIAKIFANSIDAEITELDAASNSSVNDVREIIDKSKFMPIGRKYKCFIIDECHSLSNAAWQALLLTLEEPTPTSIFIFCTTDPQKIPATIPGRCQRYVFSRISNDGIIGRLKYIIDCECKNHKYTYTEEALKYIAKLANGGMRNAISMLEETLEYTDDITTNSVCVAVGTSDPEKMLNVVESVYSMDKENMLLCIEALDSAGTDLKKFVSDLVKFVLDLCKFSILKNLDLCQIPDEYEERISAYPKELFDFCNNQFLDEMLKLNSAIRWESQPKAIIEATLIVLCSEG